MTKEAVQEIARMQHTIDTYEVALCQLGIMCMSKKDMPIQVIDGNALAASWIEKIYMFIKQHINESVRIKLNQDDCAELSEVYEKWKERRKSK